jgi:hypothetical protein
MSWDVFVQDIPDVGSVSEIPDDFQPVPLNLDRSKLIDTILETCPTADTTDPSWIVIDGPDFNVEVNLGPSSTVDHFAFHGRGDLAPGVVSAVTKRLGLRAFDPQSTTGMFDHSRAQESYDRWRRYRDHALGEVGDPNS